MNATNSRKPRQRRQHTRTIAVVGGPTPNGAVLVKLTQDGTAFHYWVAGQGRLRGRVRGREG